MYLDTQLRSRRWFGYETVHLSLERSNSTKLRLTRILGSSVCRSALPEMLLGLQTAVLGI